MAELVKAAVKIGVEEIEIREYERPIIPTDGGLLRVESAGVGGSDPETYRKPDHAPIIMGHENVGTIVELGTVAEARWGLKVGDRVALHEYLPCWHCEWCRRGDFRLCMEVDFFNVKDCFRTLRFGMSSCDIAPHLWGGFAEHMYLPANSVMHKIPHDLPAHLATLAIPMGNGVQWAVADGGTKPGDTVLIFGPGQQGLGCALAAKAAGASTVILTGMTRDKSRLDLGLRMGGDFTINVETEDLRERVLDITKNRGVDVVVDTTGDPTGKVVEDSVFLAVKGGYLSLNGLKQSVPIGDIKKKYLTVRAPRGRSYDAVELALSYIASGKYPLEEMCSHDFGLSQVDEAIKATAGKVIENAIHVTVNPWK